MNEMTVHIGLNKEGQDLLNKAKDLAEQAAAIFEEIKTNPDRYIEFKDHAPGK